MSAAVAAPSGFAIPYDFVPSPESLEGRILLDSKLASQLTDPNVPAKARVKRAIQLSPVFPKGLKDAACALIDLFDFASVSLGGLVYTWIAKQLGGFHRSKPIRLVQLLRSFEILQVDFNFWRDRPEPPQLPWWNVRANGLRARLSERCLIKLQLVKAPEGGLPERCPVCEHYASARIELALAGRDDEILQKVRAWRKDRKVDEESGAERSEQEDLQIMLARIFHVQVRELVAHEKGHPAPPLPRPPQCSTPYAVRRPELLLASSAAPEIVPLRAAPRSDAAAAASLAPTSTAKSPITMPPTAIATAIAPAVATVGPAPLPRDLDPEEVELLAELGRHATLSPIASREMAIEVHRVMVTTKKSFAQAIASIRGLVAKALPGANLKGLLVTSFLPNQRDITDAEALRGTLVASLIFRKDAGIAERLLDDARAQNSSVKLHEVFALVREAELSFATLGIGNEPRARREHLRGTVIEGLAAAMAKREQLEIGQPRSEIRRFAGVEVLQAFIDGPSGTARAPP